MFEEALNRIAEKAREMTGKHIETVKKEINGVKYRGICVQYGSVSKNIYLQEESLSSLKDSEIENILRKEIGDDKEAEKVHDFAQKINKEFILEKAKFRLLNRERNAAFENICPFEKCMDLAAYYYAEDGGLCLKITKQVIEEFGVTREELKTAAEKKLWEDIPVIRSLGEQVNILSGHEENWDEDRRVVVLTNKKNKYGASLMLHIPWMQAVAKYMNESSFYVVPASVHEVICVASNRMDGKNLKSMLREINRHVLEKDEFLSDTLYHFDSRKCRIRTCR